MTASPAGTDAAPAPFTPRRGMRAPWPLRRRLVVALVALIALVSLVIGATSVLALRANLLTRLDQQVHAELNFAEGGGPGGAPDGDNNGGSATPTFQRISSLRFAQLNGVVITAIAVDDEGTSIALNAAQEKILAAVPAQTPTTVELPGLGSYRVQAVRSTSGIIVAGLSLAEVTTTTDNLILIFVLVALAALVVAGIVGTIVVRVALRPLGRVVATATRVSELPLSKGEVALADRVPEADTDPRTEVGQVGSALNRLLGHVEGALVARQNSEDRVRQFVADASHELRTPLASIRGYSELTRRGQHELPDDVVRALGRIESESIRMTSLVEDLLLLARLDAGRELVLGDVDLVPLLADAVGDAHAAGPDHEWRLDVPEEPVIVAGDGSRLHQVVANLLANARVHTPAGTTVTASLAVDEAAAEAVVTIADDGPGIPPGLLPVLFERFARGDGSRSRTAGSTGLGLAIVHAVVEGHHGTVSVESEPGTTRFSVRLPLRRRLAD